MRVDYKKIIPYVEYLTQKISAIMSGDGDEKFLSIETETDDAGK
jgi:heat-inducible transcriptional repressor